MIAAAITASTMNGCQNFRRSSPAQKPGGNRKYFVISAKAHIHGGTISVSLREYMLDVSQLDQNHLFRALPTDVRDRIFPSLELVVMPLGHVLYESGNVLKYVYFPTDCIVSLLYVMENGASAEIAIVGNEGMIGIALFMGGETTPSRAVVQSAGAAYRLKGSLLKTEFARSGSFQNILLRYTQALLTQMSQTAVCNRHHTVEQQLCRWLLLSLDRLASNQLNMTQELIANMLGVRREGVTDAAGKLQERGLIRYSRGRITVLNRPVLEATCCECYAVVKREFDRLLPPVSLRAVMEGQPASTQS